jgi:NAD-dependent SIR2 family protein deacetylase
MVILKTVAIVDDEYLFECPKNGEKPLSECEKCDYFSGCLNAIFWKNPSECRPRIICFGDER